MKNNTEIKLVTPKMERPNPAARVRTGLRAGGYETGGVTHTDNWREGSRQ